MIFAPAVWLMLRLTNERKLPLMLAIFFLPLAVLYNATAEQLTPAIKAWTGGWVLLGIYVMTAFYLHSKAGWTKVLGPFQRLAEGDLTGHVDATGLSGHFGLVLRHLEDIKRRFGEIVAQVRSSSEMVVRSAREIAEGNSNLSRRTEQQASTLEETASGMEQLSPPQIRGEPGARPCLLWRMKRDENPSRGFDNRRSGESPVGRQAVLRPGGPEPECGEGCAACGCNASRAPSEPCTIPLSPPVKT